MEPLLVDGHVGNKLLVSRAIAAIGVVIGLGLVAVDQPVIGWIVLGGSSAVVIVLQAQIIRQRVRRRWVQDTGSGFHVRDLRGERDYDDEDVFGVDLEVIPVFSQGVRKGVRRIFRVKVEGEPKPLLMTNFFKEGMPDPLQELIARIVGKYREQAREAILAGAVLQGKEWSLSKTTLTIKSRPDESADLSDLVSVGVFDSKVCVWKKGSDEPILSVPVRAPNSFLLQLLLERMLEEQESEHDGASTEGLGRILFERKGKRPFNGLLIAVGLLLLAMGIGGILTGILQGDSEPLWVGGIMLLMGAAFGFAGVSMWRGRFRCHERGVHIQSLFSETQLRYEDVREFTYTATRQYYNGVYIGTSLALKLIPATVEAGKPVKYTTSVKNADDSLDQLRDHISHVIALKMLQQLGEGNRVQWTPNLALLPEGIEYRPGGLLRRKESQLLPYSELHGFDIQEGTFHLWNRIQGKSIMQESIGAANFFPGYYALVTLLTHSEVEQNVP